MSKAIDNVFGSGPSTPTFESNYKNYLKNYDTYRQDQAVRNMENLAYNMSKNFSDLPDIQFSVGGSDEARKRMENAVYQSYVDKLTPQFTRQRNDLETSLINKGLGIGSEAYQRAMTDLYDTQTNALNQAAYTSVDKGQSAFSQSLADNIYMGNFSNNARQSYLEQILSLLKNSVFGYENQANLYNLNKDGYARYKAEERQQIEDEQQFMGDVAKIFASL